MSSTSSFRTFFLLLEARNRAKAAFAAGAWVTVASVEWVFLAQGNSWMHSTPAQYLSASVTSVGGALVTFYIFQIIRFEERVRLARQEAIESKARTFCQITEMLVKMLFRLETIWCNNPKPLSIGAQHSLERIRGVAHRLETRNERIKLLLQIQTTENTRRVEGLLLLPVETDDKTLSLEINYSLQPAETVAKELRSLFRPIQDELLGADSSPSTQPEAQFNGNEDFHEMNARRAVL